MGLEGRPSFALGMAPVEAIDIPAVSRSGRSDLLRLLETPPKLRDSGFDLYTGLLPELAEGARVRRAAVKGYKLLELWRDGTLIFVAPADEGFLSWDIYYESGQPYSIRPLVLVESTLLFCRLADRVYKLAERMPDHLQFALELREINAPGQPARLKPGEDRLNVPDLEEPKVAPYGGNAFPVKLAAGTPPEVVAYQLVREVYAWFNYADNQVPYSEERAGQFRIVLDHITR